VVRFLALGSVDLVAPDGRELRSVLARPKLLGLLAYLSAHAPGPFHRRDTLLALLWPEASDERARAALRQALYHLRNALGEGVLVGRGDDEVGLDATRFWSDVAGFEAALAAGDREGSLDLYRGDLLPGFFLSEAPEFERWLDERRSALRRRAAAAACELAEEAAGDGNPAATGRWGQRALELAPLDEGVARTVLSLLDRAGDRAGAVHLYAAFARRLDEELGIEPAPETRSLIEAITTRSAGRQLPGPPADAEAVPSGGRLASPPLALEPLPSEVAPASLAVSRSVPKSPRRWPAVAAACAAVAVVALAAAMLWKGPAQDLSERRIAMGPFENRTGDARLDAVGAMAADWAAGALRRADLVEVADPELTRQALLFARAGADGASRSGVRIAAEAAGARLVASGSYDLVGDTVLLVARVTDAESDVVLAQLDPVRALRTDPAAAIAEMSSRLTGAVATLTDASVRALADAGRQPPTYEAYRAYAEAEALFNQAYAPGQGQLHDVAIDRYLEAFASDTTLVEALMRAAEAETFLGRRGQADSLAAIVVRRRDELSPYSRRRLDLLLATLADDLDARLRAARLLPDTPLDLAEAALLANRPREAIGALTAPPGEAYRRSIADLGWEWLDLFAARFLASAHHSLGDFASELRVAEAMRERYPNQSSGLAMEVQALAALARAADVERLLDSAVVVPQGDGPPPLSIMLQAAIELRAHGDDAAARRAAERAVAWLDAAGQADPRSSPPGLRAGALFLAERLDEAGVAADTLLARAPADPSALGLVGLLAARRGDKAEAQRRLDELATLPPRDPRGDAFRWRTGILAALGDEAGAMGLLRDAVSQGWIQPGELHRDLLLEPLWDRPAFRELIRPRG
jgi:DNA-binding SARP family transcriptional activator